MALGFVPPARAGQMARDDKEALVVRGLKG